MRSLQNQIGHEKFIDILKEASENMYNTGGAIRDFSERTLELWTSMAKRGLESWSNRLTFEIVREDAEVFEIKITECLWAKTFNEGNAADLGYAGICNQDFGNIKRFNPQPELIRENTLMQGADCCIFKWQKKES